MASYLINYIANSFSFIFPSKQSLSDWNKCWSIHSLVCGFEINIIVFVIYKVSNGSRYIQMTITPFVLTSDDSHKNLQVKHLGKLASNQFQFYIFNDLKNTVLSCIHSHQFGLSFRFWNILCPKLISAIKFCSQLKSFLEFSLINGKTTNYHILIPILDIVSINYSYAIEKNNIIW